MIYLDNSATTRVCEGAVQAALAHMTQEYYNPSAPYGAALAVEKQFLQARKTIAESLGVRPEEIFFTSGGTESNNTALFGAMAAGGEGQNMIVSAGEHPSVYDAALQLQNRGVSLRIAPLEKDGTVSTERLGELVDENTALASIMHVNNETGAVNDLAALAAAAKSKNPKAIFHSDGVQAYLRLPAEPKSCGVDMYSLSGHKIHGPKGIGALYIKKGIPIKPLLYGGGQQENMRSGTLPMPGIMALAAAAEEMQADEDYSERLKNIKAAFVSQLADIPESIFLGETDRTAPHIISIAFAHVQAQVLQNALEAEGVIVGKGSACSSRSAKVSRVSEAMGVPAQYGTGGIRISLGRYNTLAEAEPAAAAIAKAVEHLRKFRRK